MLRLLRRQHPALVWGTIILLLLLYAWQGWEHAFGGWMAAVPHHLSGLGAAALAWLPLPARGILAALLVIPICLLARLMAMQLPPAHPKTLLILLFCPLLAGLGIFRYEVAIPTQMALVAILWALWLLQNLAHSPSLEPLFRASFLLATATLLHYPTLPFLIIPIFALAHHGVFNGHSVSLWLTGTLVPFILALAIGYIIGEPFRFLLPVAYEALPWFNTDTLVAYAKGPTFWICAATLLIYILQEALSPGQTGGMRILFQYQRAMEWWALLASLAVVALLPGLSSLEVLLAPFVAMGFARHYAESNPSRFTKVTAPLLIVILLAGYLLK